MTYESILFQFDQGIATITFNRPKALNALNQALLGELSRALDDIAADENIRVLILTGAGEKAFVAGFLGFVAVLLSGVVAYFLPVLFNVPEALVGHSQLVLVVGGLTVAATLVGAVVIVGAAVVHVTPP